MGRVYESIDRGLEEFLARQHVFFVGTAPSGTEGHINVSPKGLDCFRILDPQTVAYLDLTGSGIETVAHLKENGRITLMFCAFEGAPNIVRLYGRGEVIVPGSAEFPELLALFPDLPGVRSIIRVRLDRIADSCGYAVPLMTFEGDRTQLTASARARGAQKLVEYRRNRNMLSIDGMPGLNENEVGSAGWNGAENSGRAEGAKG